MWHTSLVFRRTFLFGELRAHSSCDWSSVRRTNGKWVMFDCQVEENKSTPLRTEALAIQISGVTQSSDI